jgi:hypothetical protein
MGTQEPGYRVLLLYSESRLTPSVVSADQALRSTLEARLSRPVHSTPNSWTSIRSMAPRSSATCVSWSASNTESAGST